MPELSLKRDDRGAVGTVFAVLLAGGVLLGFLGLVIDIGQIYVEREELQSGADAAALAVARACAVDAIECASDAAMFSLAQRYADANAGDGRSRVVGICGRLAGRIDECPAPAGNLTDCLGGRPAGPAAFVEVRLGTEVPGDRFVLPPVFAQAMAGNAGYQGADVAACARAGWTPHDQVSIVALTMSDCAFASATADGFADPDSAGPLDERVIELVPEHATCPGDPPGPGLRAGPAGWLTGDGACQARLSSGGEVTATVDPTVPAACVTRLRQARDRREIVYVPVYDRVSTGLPQRTYHQAALAPFLVTGWRLGPTPADLVGSSLSPIPVDPCGGPATRCVAGLFVGATVPVSGSVAGGTAIVTLIG